jgi:DNA adenine methylase
MSSKSPLRYPGGKTRAIQILKQFVPPGKKVLLSPFVGGGSFELALHSEGYTVKANDLFRPLAIFWKYTQQFPKKLVREVKKHMPVTKEKFRYFRENILNFENELEIATAYYIINRCSFSGSTFCGGYSKQAAEGRLTESSLKTLLQINLKNVEFSSTDCCDFLEQHPETEETLVYADPPYYISTYIYGKDGDMHVNFNHEKFADCIQKRRDWIISYNDCSYIRTLYKGCRFFSVSWAYGMNAGKESSELVILPPVKVDV